MNAKGLLEFGRCFIISKLRNVFTGLIAKIPADSKLLRFNLLCEVSEPHHVTCFLCSLCGGLSAAMDIPNL